MSLPVGELYATLQLEKGAFEKGLRSGGNALTGFAKAALATGAVIGGALAVAIRGAIGVAQTFYRASSRVAAITGLNITEASKLVAVLHAYGIEGDSAVKVAAMLEKNVGKLTAKTKTATAFEKLWGFSLRDANGHVKAADKLILQAADYFTNKHIPATKKAALEAALFGKSWQELVPILKLGSQGILDAEAAAQALGVVLTAQNAKDLADYRQGQRELGEAWAGIQLQLALLVIPILTALASTIGGVVLPAIRGAVAKVGEWIGKHRDVVTGIGDLIGALLKMAGLIAGKVVGAISAIATKLGDWYRANKPLIDQLNAFAESTFATGVATIADALSKLGVSAGAVLSLAGAFAVLYQVLTSNALVVWITTAIVAVGLLREAWDSNFGGIQDRLHDAAETFRGFADRVLPKLQAAFEKVAAVIVPIIGQAFDFIATNVLPVLETAIGFLTDTVIPALLGAFSDAHAWAQDKWTAIGAFIQAAATAIGQALDFLSVEVLPRLAAAGTWAADTFGPPLASIFETFTTVILPALQEGFRGVVDFIASEWPTISSIVGQVAGAVGAAFGAIADVIAFVAPIIIDIAKVVFPILAVAAKVLLGAIDVAFKGIGLVVAELAPKVRVIFDILAGLWQGLVDVVKFAWEHIVSLVHAIGDVWGGLVGLFQTVQAAIGGIIRAGMNFVVGILNGIIRAVDSVQVHIGRIGLDTPAGFVGVGPFDWNGLQIPQLPYLAKGSDWFPGGWAMLGERGPELAELPRGSKVHNAHDTADILAGAGGSEVHYHLHAEGVVEAKDEASVLTTLQRLAAVAG